MNNLSLYWDYEQKRFVRGLSDPREVTTIEVPARDIWPVSIAIVERDSIADAYTAQTLADGEGLQLAVKVDPGETEYLFEEDTFAGPADSDDPRYTADIDINTTAVVTAIGSSEYVYVCGELTLTKSSRNYYSTRFRVKLINDIARSESTPSPAVTDKFKIIDGVPHIWNEDQSKYFPISVSGNAGQETVEIGSEGVEA